MMTKKITKNNILITILFFISISLHSQNIFISQGGIVNVNGGESFYDAGGPAGNDGNTSYTITLMPEVGKSVCVDFTSFSSFESLDIYDGPTLSANNIGSLKGNYGAAYNAAGSPYNTGQPALGGVVQAELKPGIFCANNASGALTFKFTNTSGSQSTGWVGNVSIFTNTSTGCTVDITATPTSICPGGSVTLSAFGTIGSSVLSNDFNAGNIGAGWNATPGGVAFVNVLSCQPNNGYNTMKTDGTIYAWMQNVMAPRILESNSFDVSNGGVISFDFRAASDDNGGNGCEANDDKEGVYVQYSTNNGITWINMKLLFPSVESNVGASANIGAGTYVYDWNRTTIPIPPAAQTSNTKFRWYQHQSTTGSQDSWGIDDVKIIKNNTVTITITDLSTNTVVATTTTSSINTTISPASTRAYRATITDGTTSCFDDIIITVAGGTPTTVSYSSTTFLNNISTQQNINITNGTVSGTFSAIPAGLSINSVTGAITPSTSSVGLYTVSVPTACGSAITTVEILSSSCTTCSNPSCPVSSILATTAIQGQTNITTTLNTAGDQFGNAPLTPGQSITICVPVTVVAGSTILGFKQLSASSPGGCAIPSEEIITYQLKSATNCSGSAIAPTVTNASSVASGFNPEWNGLTPGNYVLCLTLNVVNTAICFTVDLQGLGYYNVVPACTNPIITTQPQSTQTICKNTVPTNLVTAATGTSLTYQWYSNAVNSNVGGTLISGATSSTYTPPTNIVGTLYYYVIVSSGTCSTKSNAVSVVITNVTLPTYTINSSTCSLGSISFGTISPTGTTFNWISGPSGYTFPVGFTSPSTTNSSLSNLPAGTYCVEITSPTTTGGSTTTTLLTENFETNAPNWTINNSGGNNIFIINNSYLGGNCTIGGVPFAVPNVPNEGAWSTPGPQSKYLHIKATTTCGFACAEGGAFPPANANYCSTSSDQKFTLNTPLSTLGKTNVTVSFYYINKGTDIDDYGSLEYSINGGTTWIQAGANLTGHTTWFNQITTLPAWDNQASLLFRIRWRNDASSSSDPPLCIDEILITALETIPTSCGSTVQECITINSPLSPTISCGSSTTSSIQFNWAAVIGATGYTVSYQVNASPVVNIGAIGNVLSYNVTGLNSSDSVSITVTPTGGTGTCFSSASKTCAADSCPTILTPTGAQSICISDNPTALSVNSTFTGTNAISFVYFTTPQTGSNMYTGGTLLSNITPSIGIASYNPGILGTAGSLPNVAATYYIYAIANPTPTGSTCRPFQEIIIVVSSIAVPTISTTAATCLASGSSTISNYVVGTTYTFTPIGPSVGATGLISGMTIGTSYTVTAGNTNCTSASSTSFVNATQLPTPAVPTISTTAATCAAAGSSSISNYVAGTTYTFTPTGPTVGTTGLISGMTIAASYTVTAGNTNCTSAASSLFVNAAQLVTPAVLVSGNLNYCNGDTTAITLSSSVLGTTFSWNIVSANLTTGVGFVTSGTGSTINQNVSLLNQNNAGTITYLVTPEANGCYGTPIEIHVLVNTIPAMTISVANITICSGGTTQINLSSTNSATTYSWTIVAQNGVLGANNGSGSIIQQVLTTSSPIATGNITYEITPSANGCLGVPSQVTLTVNPNPQILGTLLPVTICSGESTSIVVLGSLPGTQYSWSIIASQGIIGFSNGTGNTISQVLETTSDSQGYVIYEITPSLNGCSGQPKQYKVYVNPLPKPKIEDGNICVNQSTGITYQGYLLDSGLTSSNYSFEWYFNSSLIPGAIFSSYLADQPGIYLIKVVNTLTGCMAQDSALVTEVFPATSISASVSDTFTENATISVIVDSAGSGNLLFQLDNGVYQALPFFENVSPGIHTVTVIDSEGCTYISINVLVINYPHYFTPNGDGIHDTWNIVGLQSENHASIYIFDRYGKLIKQISPFGVGWDGTYNGNMMPSTDYWFKVEYKENDQAKEFKSHFCLKR